MEDVTPERSTGFGAALRALLTPERVRLLRFCIVGASGVFVNLGVFELAFIALTFVAANALGIAVSIFTNFLLNDRWTWGDREKSPFLQRLTAFYVVSLSAAVVQLGAAWVCYEWLGMHRHVALLLGIAAATGINFISNNIWTFRAKRS